jgi:hypothetical protein
MWYITVHGVGDSEPGASAEKLALLMHFGEPALAAGGRSHRQFHVEILSPACDITNRTWSDLGRPGPWATGIL